MEKVQPRIFHIHIDAQVMPREIEEYAINQLHFKPTDYDGHPEGYDHFEPKHHLTLKIQAKEDFQIIWNDIENFINAYPDFIGYIEGEYLPLDEYIPYKEYIDIGIPFNITRRKLTSSNNEEFRQTEIHVTMEKTQSHPDLIKKLLESGLYGAFIPKHDGEFLVLTIQGFIRDIAPLVNSLKNFLIESGGSYRCTIKEERSIAHKLYSINSSELPEIAEKIVYY